VRRHAPEVLATAEAQRWDPTEVLKALFAEEVAGRERSALATRRAAAGPRSSDGLAEALVAVGARATVARGGSSHRTRAPRTPSPATAA